MINYNEIIQRIRKIEDFESRMRELESLYTVKPVRLMWYVVKAETLAIKDIGTSWKILENKYCLDYLYEGVEDVERVHQKVDASWQDIPLIRYRDYVIARLKEDVDMYHVIEHQISELENIVTKEFEQCKLQELSDLYLSTEKWISYIVLRLCVDHIYNIDIYKREWVLAIPNMGYISECIRFQKKVIICIDTLIIEKEAFILGRCFAEMGCPTYILALPEKIEVNEIIDLKNTLSISLDNTKEVNGFVLVPVVELLMNGKKLGNNSEYIIDSICQQDEANLLIASSVKFAELSQRRLLQKRIGNLFEYKDGFRADNFTFGWCGSYIGYINQLYQMNVKKCLEEKKDCKFSIIIPARNSSSTLRYTLQTCLEQTYQGEYEILISDNSTGQNADVYELCKELNDSRIRYVKTPRDLHLPKSFEYAYLNARGEYILSIGSDDGVLPWALEVLDLLIQQYPDEDIIQWERGFYAWPGFNGGQQNQFKIPRAYDIENLNVYYKKTIDYMANVLNNTTNMYELPMLYINSCFKRSYMQTLLEKTGRLWDGTCQDIYIGVVNICINFQILNIEYPLTIAGMSSNSEGAKANEPKETNEEFTIIMQQAIAESNVGGYCRSYWEQLVPFLGTDIWSLYTSLLRAISIGILSEEYLDKVFNWKKIYLDLYSQLDIRDVAYDRKIHEMRYVASKHGEEFLQWFDENIYKNALIPRLIDEEKIAREHMQKKYKDEINQEGGITLDASEYGVKNIYDAVQLFAKIMELDDYEKIFLEKRDI